MSGFPKLIPAFTVQIHTQPGREVGALTTGPSLTQVAFLEGQGGITSEADYPIALNATWRHGADYVKADPDGEHVQLNVNGVAEDKATGGLVHFHYTGVIDMRGPAGAALRGDAGAATTEYKDIFSSAKFETGHPSLKALEHKVFVGRGRFVLEAGKPLVVEYKVSEVSA